MEATLDALRGFEDTSKAASALNLIHIYFNNIEKDPKNPKFRKIRIANAKFSSTIWDVEPARTFLFLCGFEHQEDYLVLPESVSVSAAKLLIDGLTSTNTGQTTSELQQTGGELQQRAATKDQEASLKLSAPKGASFFDQEIKPDLTLLSYMVEMGYNKNIAEKALKATKNTGVQPAMDWITLNPEVFPSSPASASTPPSGTLDKQLSSPAHTSPPSTGLTISTTAKPPVSRYQKTADERHKFQEKLRLEAIEAARIEKQAKAQHREYLLKDMQANKEEKKERAELAKKLKTTGQTTEDSCTESVEQREDEQPCSSQEDMAVELRLRLPDGQTTMVKLPKQAHIAEIYQHVCRATHLSQSDFLIMTSYPQMELTNMTANLQEAGLAPRAALVVQRRDQQGVVTEGHGQVCTVRNIHSIEEWQSALGSSADKLLVVEFYANWCSNCRSIADQFDSLNAEFGINEDIVFLRVDVDQLRVLKHQLRITTLPTFKLFWNERDIAEHQGADLQPLQQLIQENRDGPATQEQEQPMDEELNDPR